MTHFLVKYSIPIIIIFGLISAGCSVSPPPPTHYFLLDNPPSSQKTLNQSPKHEIAVNLGEIVIAPPYDGENLVVKLKDGEIQYYNYQKWGAPPAKMIHNYLNKTFLFNNIFIIGNRRIRTKNSYLLKLEFEEFAHNRVNQNHFGSLIVFAGLTRHTKTTYDWFKVYTIQIPTSTDQITDIVKALNRGIQNLTKEILKDMDLFFEQKSRK